MVCSSSGRSFHWFIADGRKLLLKVSVRHFAIFKFDKLRNSWALFERLTCATRAMILTPEQRITDHVTKFDLEDRNPCNPPFGRITRIDDVIKMTANKSLGQKITNSGLPMSFDQ